MLEEIIIAGFGGQGIMLAGQLLTYAGLEAGFQVLWYPAYGPETRGGYANCTVIVSTEDIASPVVSEADTIIVMNKPSLLRYEGKVKKGGLLIINSSLIDQKAKRSDIEVFYVPVNEIANELGELKVANMVAVGAYIAIKNLFPIEYLTKVLPKMLPGRRHNLIPINEKAIYEGVQFIEKLRKTRYEKK